MISGERLKTLGRIIGVSEESLALVAEEFEIHYSSAIQFEEFQMYYYDLF